MKNDSNSGLLENVVAISVDMHTSKHYDAFYRANADRLGGFTGIYDLCIAMAKRLTQWEEQYFAAYGQPVWDKSGLDWPDVTEVLSRNVLTAEDTDVEKCFALTLAQLAPRPWVVETRMWDDSWENTWNIENEHLTFATREEAQASLDRFIKETEEDAAAGHLDEAYDPAHYRVVNTVTGEGRN